MTRRSRTARAGKWWPLTWCTRSCATSIPDAAAGRVAVAGPRGRAGGMESRGLRLRPAARRTAGCRSLHAARSRLRQPYPQLLYTLAHGLLRRGAPRSRRDYGREFGLRPVGSGPFRVTSYDTARIVLEPNRNWRWRPVDLAAEGYDPDTQAFTGIAAIDGQTPPFVDRLMISFITDSAARWNSFTKGNEIQYAGVPVELVDRVLASKRPVRLAPNTRPLPGGVRHRGGLCLQRVQHGGRGLRLSPGPRAAGAQSDAALRDDQGLRLGPAQRQLLLRPGRGVSGRDPARWCRSSTPT